MSKTYLTALTVLTALFSVSSVALADTYESAMNFQPMTGSNEAVITRNLTSNYIANSGTSDIFVVGSPSRSLPVPAGSNQTVTVTGLNGAATGYCLVRSMAPNGIQTAAISQNMPAGYWTLNFTFTPAQAPAGNNFIVYCTLNASNGNRLFSLSVSP